MLFFCFLFVSVLGVWVDKFALSDYDPPGTETLHTVEEGLDIYFPFDTCLSMGGSSVMSYINETDYVFKHYFTPDCSEIPIFTSNQPLGRTTLEAGDIVNTMFGHGKVLSNDPTDIKEFANPSEYTIITFQTTNDCDTKTYSEIGYIILNIFNPDNIGLCQIKDMIELTDLTFFDGKAGHDTTFDINYERPEFISDGVNITAFVHSAPYIDDDSACDMGNYDKNELITDCNPDVGFTMNSLLRNGSTIPDLSTASDGFLVHILPKIHIFPNPEDYSDKPTENTTHFGEYESEYCEVMVYDESVNKATVARCAVEEVSNGLHTCDFDMCDYGDPDGLGTSPNIFTVDNSKNKGCLTLDGSDFFSAHFNYASDQDDLTKASRIVVQKTIDFHCTYFDYFGEFQGWYQRVCEEEMSVNGTYNVIKYYYAAPGCEGESTFEEVEQTLYCVKDAPYFFRCPPPPPEPSFNGVESSVHMSLMMMLFCVVVVLFFF